MSNILRSSTKLAMSIVKNYIKEGTVAVDATCGNGHDTLSLIENGCSVVYAFDIQPEAISSAKKLLMANHIPKEAQAKFILANHRDIPLYVNEANVIIFNLGYLPCGDKTITTKRDNTLSAVKNSLDILAVDGIISIAMYSGHKEGKEEKEALLDFAKTLDKRIFHVAYINLLNQPNNPPEILLITRKEK